MYSWPGACAVGDGKCRWQCFLGVWLLLLATEHLCLVTCRAAHAAALSACVRELSSAHLRQLSCWTPSGCSFFCEPEYLVALCCDVKKNKSHHSASV